MNFIKSIIKIVFICMIFCNSSVFAEENYDPKHTMLALNMAIVSVHRIVSSEDRNVLTLEYNNIINNLKIGNIESDYEMTSLYTELMNVISNKTLRQEDCSRILARYKKNEQRAVFNAISGIRAYGGDWKSWLLSLATSCVSQYFSYRNIKEDLQDTLDDDLWRLKKEEIRDCNELQKKLLSSSWSLLRKYNLPDDYRLTQDILDSFYKTNSESNINKRLRMLRIIEQDFKVYPPYWLIRCQTANAVGDSIDAQKCFEKFEKVWRPVLRKDPYKQEAVKYAISEISKREVPSKGEIAKLLPILKENTFKGDWANTIFSGIVAFVVGEKAMAVSLLEENIDFKYEIPISSALLSQIKCDKLDASSLSPELAEIVNNLSDIESGDNKKSNNCDICNGLGYTSIYESKKCSECNGTGKIKYEGTVKCTTCHGSGHIICWAATGIGLFGPPEIPCEKCKGTGENSYNYSQDCNNCKGSGFVKEENRKTCYPCNGTGKKIEGQ